jgi:hypothetical protein
MPRPSPHDWEPFIFDDHGQPAFHTQEEEQKAWDDYVALGPDYSSYSSAVHHAIDDLTAAWHITTDPLTTAVIGVQIAEHARREAARMLSAIVCDTPRPAQDVYHDIATRTGLDPNHLADTYPITPDPPF